MELALETYSDFLCMRFHISFTISCPLAGALSGVLSFCVTGGVRWGTEHASSERVCPLGRREAGNGGMDKAAWTSLALALKRPLALLIPFLLQILELCESRIRIWVQGSSRKQPG